MRLVAYLLFIGIVFSISPQQAVGNNSGGYMWRPDTISLDVRFRDPEKRMGQYILLENALREGETGWTMSKMSVPDDWIIKDLRIQDQEVTFAIQTEETFRISPPQLNELNFKLLDGGDKSQKRIESLWRQYAKK